MKKLMKSMLTLAALLIAMAANAETKEVTFDFAANSWGKTVVTAASEKKVEANAFGSETIDGVTLNTQMGTAVYYPALRKMADGDSYSNPYLDLVKNNKLALEVKEGTIASVTFNYTSTITASCFVAGDWTSSITNEDKTEILTLNAPAASLELTLSRTGYVKSMTVAITTEGGSEVNPDPQPGEDEKPELSEDEKALDDNTAIDLSKRLIVAKFTYGDAMGEVSRSTCTGQKNYYYDKNLMLANITNNKAEMEGLTFVTTDYVYYNYNENNQITSERGYQIGTYDYGEKEAKESRASHADYVYDENGQLVSKTDAEGTTTYEYNEAGQIFQEVTSTGKTLQYTYNADGTVASVENVVTDEYAYKAPSEAYKEKYTYSEAGRKIKVERVYARDVEYLYFKMGNNEVTKWHYADEPISVETWKYVGGYLTENYKYAYNNNFDKIPASRLVYNYSEDKNTVTYTKEIYNEQKGTWSLQPTTTVDQYKDYSLVPAELYASEIISAKQSTDPKDGLNCAEVEFTLPQLIMTDQTLDIIVYRDGIRVQTINPAMWDLVPEYNLTYNEQTGNLIYKDKRIKNGTHEYFFQTAPSVTPGFNTSADEDIDGGGVVTPIDHEESFIVSNRVPVEIFTALPVATELSASGTSSSATEVNVTVDFKYDAEIKSEYGFKKSFLVANGALFIDEDNASVQTANPSTKRLSSTYDAGVTVSLTVVTQYELGTVVSEPLVINTNDIITSIDAISTEMMNGKTMMFDLQGRQVASPAKGVFIMVKNGKATKVTVK